MSLTLPASRQSQSQVPTLSRLHYVLGLSLLTVALSLIAAPLCALDRRLAG